LQNFYRMSVGSLLALMLFIAPARTRNLQEVTVTPRGLVQLAVSNEVNASNGTNNFMFRSRKQTASGSQTKLLVQTREAMAGILIAINDQPLTPEQRQAEEGRLEYLIGNPAELKRKQKQEADNADRVRRIVRALPDAFQFEHDGVENGRPGIGQEGDQLIRLKFRPNPHYAPPSRVEQVLLGMQGIVLIDEKRHRIARMDGTLFKDVSFGWGILGHLDKGGRFQVEQGRVADNGWETTHMALNFTGKVLLFKSIVIRSEEHFSDFQRVPPSLSFAEGVSLLKKQQSANAENKTGQ
jgi:hypothetical protein